MGILNSRSSVQRTGGGSSSMAADRSVDELTSNMAVGLSLGGGGAGVFASPLPKLDAIKKQQEGRSEDHHAFFECLLRNSKGIDKSYQLSKEGRVSLLRAIEEGSYGRELRPRLSLIQAVVNVAQGARRGQATVLGSSSKGDEEGLIPAADLAPFLEPDYDTAYVAPPSSSPTTRYLEAVTRQNLAEFAGFLKTAFARELILVESENSERRTEYSVDNIETKVFAAAKEQQQYQDDKVVDPAELHHNLALFRGYIVLLKWDKKRGELRLLLGAAWRGRRLPNNNSQRGFGETTIQNLGYVGDYLNCHAAARAFTRGELPIPRLLKAVADPTKRANADYPRIEMRKSSSGSMVTLNAKQKEILEGLSSEVEGIQGPPGTGKSTVIAHLVQSYLPRGEVALATCVQNKAVDAIAEKLASTSTSDDKVAFFVVGNSERLGKLAKSWTVEAQVDRDPRVVALRLALDCASRLQRCVREAVEDAKKKGKNPSSYKKAEAMLVEELGSLGDRTGAELGSTKAAATAKVISEARVVLCTVATASRSLLIDETLAPAVGRLTTAILDEAGTCAETNLPLLLLIPRLKRIVAIGDQKQLAPFTHIGNGGGGGAKGPGVCFDFQKRGQCRFGAKCRFSHARSSGNAAAAAAAAAVSEPLGFFQRLEQALPEGGVPSLQEQYRMHPSIAAYISKTFYNGTLATPSAVAKARLLADSRGLHWLSYDPGRGGAEGAPERGSSKINNREALLALQVVKAQPRAAKSVMVITFYKAQETLLKKVFAQGGLDEQVHEDGAITRGSLRICSVDQAQGSEADVVVLSCVRSNSDASVGFLTNPNRLNVAVSRARERLIVLGDAKTLKAGGGKQWTSLLSSCGPINSDVTQIPAT